MRRRTLALLLAAIVLLPAVPATAAEPEPGPSPDPTLVGEPTPTPDETPSPTADASPEPSSAGEPATEPLIDPATNATDPDLDPEPVAADPAPADPDPAASATPTLEETGGLDPAGQYIVVLEAGADTSAVIERLEDSDDVDAGRTFRQAIRGFTADLDADQRAAVEDDPSVLAVVPDELIELTLQTTPTGVARIGGRSSPVAKIDGSDERVDADVAIVDTGVALHPDLNVAGGYNCSTTNRAAWADNNGHGTHVAGTVAALDNDRGVVGVAPGARIWAVKILNGDGYGYLSWYVCGLDWILAQRDPNDSSRPLIEAVNMSVTKSGSDDAACGTKNADILHAAICRLVKGGITVVAAAANDSGSATKRVPASYNEVITVSALADTDGKAGGVGGNRCSSWGGYDKDDTFADFSNYGYDVDLIAPGKCIWSTKPNNTYAYSSGTSMAAPAVTGAVALYKASRPYATPAQVKEALQYLGNLNWKVSTDPDSRHEKLLDVSRLGPLGSFTVGYEPMAAVGETGGTVVVPITLSRSATFFERVSLKLGALPSGWTGALDTTTLLGWTASQTSLRLALPKPTSAGTYAITVTGTNQGRTSATTVNIVVENDLPVARSVSASLSSAVTLGSTSAIIRLAWPAATDASSKIAGYEVQLRKNEGAWGGVTPTKATDRVIRRSMSFGATYDVRVRARDAVGNWSPWAESRIPFRAFIVDDRRSAITYYGSSWVKTTSSAAVDDTLRRSTRLGARVGYTFTGRGISVIAPTGPGRARLAIRIDGVLVKTVSLRASSTHHRRVIFAKTFASSGQHRITLEIVSSGKVQLDAFVVAK